MMSKQSREMVTVAAAFWGLVLAIGNVSKIVLELTSNSLAAILFFIIGATMTLIWIAYHCFRSRKASKSGSGKGKGKKKPKNTHR